MSAAAVPAQAPGEKFRTLLTTLNHCIPSDMKGSARLVTHYLGPSVLFTVGSDDLRNLVDDPTELYRGGTISSGTVGIGPYLHECDCAHWGRMGVANRPARRGIFESLLIDQICRRFPDRTQELHLCVIGTGGSLQVLRILALLIIVAHYYKIRLTLTDVKFVFSFRVREAYRDAFMTFVLREFIDIDPFRQVHIAANFSQDPTWHALRTLSPQVLMLCDLGVDRRGDRLAPQRAMLDTIRTNFHRPDTLFAFTFDESMFFCRFDQMDRLTLEPNRPPISLQGERGPVHATLEELDGPVTTALQDHRPKLTHRNP